MVYFHCCGFLLCDYFTTCLFTAINGITDSCQFSMSRAAVNTLERGFWGTQGCISVGHMPERGIAWVTGKRICSVLVDTVRSLPAGKGLVLIEPHSLREFVFPSCSF